MFFFNDTATSEIYTLSLHDALPISPGDRMASGAPKALPCAGCPASPGREDVAVLHTADPDAAGDRKSTRLNSSHANISYAVFCLQKHTPPDTPSPRISASSRSPTAS